MRYIIIDNLINWSLCFRAILTKVTFIMVSVASLMLDSTCFVFGLPLGTSILACVPLKFHFKAIVALFGGSEVFCRNWTLRFVKLKHPVLTDLLQCFFF
jgi:hypothetical protein